MHVITRFTAAARYACVGWVRNTVLAELAGLDLAPTQCEAIRLSVSEIVTNALLHGVGGESDNEVLHVETAPDQARGVLRVTVMNPYRSRTAPAALADADLDAETGRGLFLVQTMVDQVGWELQAGEDGILWCAVWFELEVDLAVGGSAQAPEQRRPLPATVRDSAAHRGLANRAASRLPSRILRRSAQNRAA